MLHREEAERMAVGHLFTLKPNNSDEELLGLIETDIQSKKLAVLEEAVAFEKEEEASRAEEYAIKQRLELENAKAKHDLREKNAQLAQATQNATEAAKAVELEKLAKEEALRKASEVENSQETLQRNVEKMQKTLDKLALMTAILLATLIVAVAQLLIYLLPVPWLVHHQNIYGLQGAGIITIYVLLIGAFNKKCRPMCWWIIGVGMIFVVFQILGGPSSGDIPAK